MSIGEFPESLTQAMLVGCNVSREIGRILSIITCLYIYMCMCVYIYIYICIHIHTQRGIRAEPVGRPDGARTSSRSPPHYTRSRRGHVLLLSSYMYIFVYTICVHMYRCVCIYIYIYIHMYVGVIGVVGVASTADVVAKRYPL